MTPADAAAIVARIDAIWPPRTPPTPEEREEWIRFLRTYDGRIAAGALEELRGQLGWRPSMADFKSAYQLAATMPEETRPALPAGKDDRATRRNLCDTYGLAAEDWVYCWKCDMAIGTEERAEGAGYDHERGFYHCRCPKPGTAPAIPRAELLARNEHFSRHHIASEPEWTR